MDDLLIDSSGLIFIGFGVAGLFVVVFLISVLAKIGENDNKTPQPEPDQPTPDKDKVLSNGMTLEEYQHCLKWMLQMQIINNMQYQQYFTKGLEYVKG